MTGRTAEHAPPELNGYTYVSHLGSGGYSEVYLYEQQMPRRKVAVKVLHADGLSDQARAQFTAEANATAGLADHPNIVQVFGAEVTPDGRPYLVMQYYGKPNLGVRARREHFSVADVLRIGVQIASAVETAHRAGILHRDIKPANILTGQYDAPALTDFGIAANKADAGAGEAEGMSVPWAPPEVLFAISDGDERSDVYSLGATLWHLLVGRSPFEAPGGDNSTLALMRRIQSDPPPPTNRRDVPAALERLLRQTMAKDPQARPESALALARALQSIEQDERFSLTPIAVIDDQPEAPASVREPRDEGTATVVRSPQRVEAQAPAPARPVAPPPTPPAADETRRRTPTVVSQAPAAAERPREHVPAAPDAPNTVRRAVTPTAPEPAPATLTDADAARGRGRLVGAAVGGAVIVGAAVVGAIVSSGSGHTAAATTQEPSRAQQSQSAVGPGGIAPGKPAVRATRKDATHVLFTWTYDNKVSGDVYRWQLSGAVTAPERVSTVPQQVVTTPKNQAVCLVVRVVRSNGMASESSAPVCR